MELQNCVNQIKTGEICKDAAVIKLLDVYYQNCLDAMHKDDDTYPKEFTVPIKDRQFGIYEALLWLVNEQYDFDAEYEGESALMMAVECADAPMTSFLIRNGADANKWPNMDELPSIPKENYYLEDIDIKYLNECWPRTDRYIKALLETAKVLLKEGETGSFYGKTSFTADAEKHLITLGEYKREY